MDIMITSKNNEKFYEDKNVVTIGTSPACNFRLDLDFEVLLSIQYDFSIRNYVILNTFSNKKVLFCNRPLKRLELGCINKICFENSDEFLKIRVLQRIPA